MVSPKRITEGSWAQGPILVVGKSGQLARCLYDLARQQKLPLAVAGRPDLDLGKASSIEGVVSAVAPCVIVNAAAYTAVDRAEEEPAQAYQINCEGAAWLAATARAYGIPFVHISTDYVFDGLKTSPYREDDAPAPLGVYGRSKLKGEIAVRDANPDAIVIRTSWVYSPYGQNFLRTMIRLSATQACVRVVNDQHGTPTSAVDLAAGVLEIVQQLRADHISDRSGIYHLAGRGETTWHGFAEAIFTNLARRKRPVPRLETITTAEYPTPASRPANSCLDSDKAARVFKVRLAPWQASLDRCLDQLAIQELPTC